MLGKPFSLSLPDLSESIRVNSPILVTPFDLVTIDKSTPTSSFSFCLANKTSEGKPSNVEVDDFSEAINDPFAVEDPFAPDVVPERGVDLGVLITGDFVNVPVIDCIKFLCALTKANYRIDENAVIIAEPGATLELEALSGYQLKDQEDSLKLKIQQLKKELELLETLKKFTERKEGKPQSLKENVVFDEINFDNASLNTVQKFIEKQSQNKISVAVYISADVTLPKVNIKAHNLSVTDLAKYVAEQLGIVAAVEKGEITFREKKFESLSVKNYKLKKSNYVILSAGKEISKTLERFGISSPEGSRITYDRLKNELSFKNTKANHERLKVIIDLLEK